MNGKYDNKMMTGEGYTDLQMRCQEPDCQKIFIFSAGEQQFYKEKGLASNPKRCQSCRNKRKMERNRSH